MTNKVPSRPSHLPSASQTRRNVLFIWGNRLLVILAPLIITPLITNHFGLTVTGVWLLATQVAAQLTLLDAGIATSLSRLLARACEDGSNDQPEHIISTAFWTLLTVGLLLIVCAPLAADYFVAKFPIPREVLNDSWWLILLTAVFVGISLPLRCGYGLLASMHRFDVIQVYDTIPILMRLGFIFIFVFNNKLTLLGLGLIVYISNILGLFLIFSKGLNLFYGWNALRVSNISSAALNRIMSLSFTALIISLSSAALLQGSPILIGHQMGTKAVTLITIPIFIFLSVAPFFQTFATIISPIAAGTSSSTAHKKLGSFCTITNAYLCSAALATFMVSYVFGKIILKAWLVGPSVSTNDIGAMTQVLNIILLSYALSIIVAMGRSILCSTGYHWQAALSDLFTSLLGIVLGIIMVSHFEMGVTGASLGIAFAFVLRGLLIYPVLVADYFKVSPARLLCDSIMFPLVIAITSIAAGEIISTFSGLSYKSTDLLTLIMVWLLPSLLWILLTWKYVVTPRHRRGIIGKMMVFLR